MLRNLIVISAFTLLSSVVAFGQVAVGIKGSLQFANIVISPSTTVKPGNLLGFQAGLMLNAPITDQLSIRPQLLYSVKGTKFDAQSAGTDIKTTINYLEIPVQLAYGFDAGEGKVVIGAGPYLGYALSGNATSGGQTEDFTFDDNDGLKRIDIGLHISAGYELSSGLLVSGYFSPGLTNINRTAGTTSDGSVKTTAYGLSVGYFFGKQ